MTPKNLFDGQIFPLLKRKLNLFLKILNIDSQFSTSNCLSNYQEEGFEIELDYFRETLLIFKPYKGHGFLLHFTKTKNVIRAVVRNVS